MPRSSSTLNIFRGPQPYPVFAGSLPSQSGGRRVVVLGGVDPNGDWDIQKEDVGPEHGHNEPILFVPFGGVDYALTLADLKEMLAGMRERHQRWRDEQPPTPDMTAAVKDFCQAIVDRKNGRQQFYMKETIRGN